MDSMGRSALLRWAVLVTLSLQDEPEKMKFKIGVGQVNGGSEEVVVGPGGCPDDRIGTF